MRKLEPERQDAQLYDGDPLRSNYQNTLKGSQTFAISLTKQPKLPIHCVHTEERTYTHTQEP